MKPLAMLIQKMREAEVAQVMSDKPGISVFLTHKEKARVRRAAHGHAKLVKSLKKAREWIADAQKQLAHGDRVDLSDSLDLAVRICEDALGEEKRRGA